MLDRSFDPLGAPARDSLSEILQDLRPSGVSYGHCRLSRSWGMELPPERAARLHLVVDGDPWPRAPDLGCVPLHAGDVALLPRGAGHALADTARTPTRPLAEFPREGNRREDVPDERGWRRQANPHGLL